MLISLNKTQRAAAVIRRLLLVTGVVFGSALLYYEYSAPGAKALNSTDFVITVKTDNAGTSGANQFTIPTNGAGYAYGYSVDCNSDGTVEATGLTGDYTCNYAAPGTYTLSVSGTFPQIYFNNTGDKLKLLGINQWGSGKWRSLGSAFYGCSNMDIFATDVPDLSMASTIGHAFRDAASLKGAGANWKWNTSTIINTASTFAGASSFNTDVSSWDMSKVTNMGYMFSAASSFNQNLSGWNTQSSTTFEGVFYKAAAFNNGEAPGSSTAPLSWNPSNVTSMQSMFAQAGSFNQPIGTWDTAKVTTLYGMFSNATLFNQPIGGWNTANVTNMSQTFSNAVAFNQPIGTWNLANTTNTSRMFNGARVFDQDISAWNTANVMDMSFMFSGAWAFNQPIGGWNTANVINMSRMFRDARAFDKPIDLWNTAKVTDMTLMFNGARAFNQPIGGWNMANVTMIGGMFRDAATFNQPVGAWNTMNVVDMSSVFANAVSFNQPINSWNVSKATNISSMFEGAVAFNQPINSWDTANVQTMAGMFRSATAFDQLLASLKMNSVTDVNYMLTDSGLSVYNYDVTLKMWDAQTLQSGLTLGADGLVYCTAEPQRSSIITDDAWTIVGDTKDCSVYQPKTTTYTGVTTFDSAATTPLTLGSLSTVDTDDPTATALDSFTYATTCATPSAGDNLVTISGGAISLTSSPRDLFGPLDVCIRTTNSLGQTLDTIVTFTVNDKTPPKAPTTAPDLMDTSDTGANNTDNLTNDTTPTFTATCTELGGKISLRVDGAEVGTADCVALGDVQVTPTAPLADGGYTVTFVEIDKDGNASAVSPILSLTIDKTPPATPTGTVGNATADNTINIAESTQDQIISGVISGAKTGDAVTVTVNGTAYTTTVKADGSYAATVPGSALASDADRTIDVSVTTSDVAGNLVTGTFTKGYTVDTNVVAAPAKITIVPASDTGVSNTDGVTSDTTPTVTLYCTNPTDKLTLSDGATQLQTVSCTSSGPVTVTLPVLSEGGHSLTYTAMTITGNSSPASAPLAMTIDTKAPTSNVANIPATSDRTPTVIGTIDDPAATVTVKIDGVAYPAVNNGDGTWILPDNTISPALDEGVHTVEVATTDVAGNSTKVTGTLPIAIDPPAFTKLAKVTDLSRNEVEWTLTAKNNNAAAEDVTITDSLPNASMSITGSIACSATTNASKITTCDFDQTTNPTSFSGVATLAPGETLTVTVKSKTALDAKDVTNNATAVFAGDTSSDASAKATAIATLKASYPSEPVGEVVTAVQNVLAQTGYSLYVMLGIAAICVMGGTAVLIKRRK